MTAIPAHAGVPAYRATRLRLTARGRRVLAGVAAVPAAAVLAWALLSGGSAIATAGAAAPADTFESVTVAYGDTLWSIAQEIAPGADPRDVVGEISRLNALAGAELQVGQSIAIPTQYTDAD
ncbi:LysM peptidoglycan-binding domain-containing protein [Microbacterium koreense]|uniref:LysM peptidoglycan-binding domain-containing protein n=1 Tax=Microbacterium koreense TaxID=323761 RepID=A0ABW2ZTF3_9MICO